MKIAAPELEALLGAMSELDGTDLFLTAGLPPCRSKLTMAPKPVCWRAAMSWPGWPRRPG